MAVVDERAVTRGVPRADRRSWLRWGIAVFLGVESVHTVGGLLVNDWEGWGVFFGNLSFVLVSGLLIVALIYGLLVRWGLKPSPMGRNRPAVAGLIAGVISVASYVLFWTWTPLLVAPAAVLLGREGLARAEDGHGMRAAAVFAMVLGLASFAVGVFFVGYALLHGGTFPFGLFAE